MQQDRLTLHQEKQDRIQKTPRDPKQGLKNGINDGIQGLEGSGDAPALPTCELRAEDLRVVDNVLPELLELGDPRNVLQQPHEVPADHETVHELGKRGKKVSFTVQNLIYCSKSH